MFLPRGFAVSSVGLFLLAFVVTALGTRGASPVIRASIQEGPNGPVVLGLFGRYPRVISLCSSLSRHPGNDLLARDSLVAAAGQTAPPPSKSCVTPACPYGTTADDPSGCAVASSYPIATCKTCTDWGCMEATSGCCVVCSWTELFPCYGCKTTGGCKN
jgi:hypothetical protein